MSRLRLSILILPYILSVFLSGCIPIYRTNKISSFADAVPKDILVKDSEVVVIPVTWNHLVVHFTAFDHQELETPLFLRGEELGKISDELATSTYGYFTLIGTVHGVESHITHLIIISDKNDLLVLDYKSRRTWVPVLHEKIEGQRLDKLIEAMKNQKSIDLKIFNIDSHLEENAKLKWTGRSRKGVINFLLKNK